MSSRLFEIRLYNETSIVLHRHSHSLKHGTWRSWLPERIATGSDVAVSCSFSRTFHGICFSIKYGTILNRVRYLLHIQLERRNGEETFSAVFVPENEVENALGGRSVSIDGTCPVIFKVHYELADYDGSDRSMKCFRVRVQETTDGSLYIKGLKECMEQLLIQKGVVSYHNAKVGGLEAYQVYESLPDDFTWSASSSVWLPRLRRSNRSILIRIVNFSGKQLKLILDPSSTFLEEGHWVEYPSEDIPNLCGTAFGVRSTGFFGGTGGKCVYSIMGESGTLTFSWEQPAMGSLTATGTHSMGKYSIAKHVESLNEGTIMFHIYDINPPQIDLWAAKAICPNAPAKSLDLSTLPRNARGEHMFDRIAKASSANLSNMEDVRSTVVDVLPLLLKYHSHGCEWKAEAFNSGRADSPVASEHDDSLHSGCNIGKEFFLKNPRHFFRATIIGKRRDLEKKVSDNHLLYLDWGIGAERFSKVFMPDERIHLCSTVPGGMDNRKLLFDSYLMQFHYDRPEIVIDSADAPTMHHSARERRNRPFLQHIMQDNLMDYVLMIFHALCEGLQPYITKRMSRKYGASWLDKVRIPAGHVWKNEEVVRIDVEGMVYLITAYWLDLFEDLFDGDSDTLHTIQTAAIYWANQEVYRFDINYVWDMLEATERLLYRLRAEDAIKHIEFISQKLMVP